MNTRKLLGAAGIALAGSLVGGCTDAGAVEYAATAGAEVSYEPAVDLPQVHEFDLPANTAEAIYIEEVPVHWFAALAEYGRDWACTVTSITLPGDPDALQVTQHLVGLNVDEIFSISEQLDQPEFSFEMSDVICHNSTGEELIVPGTPGFVFEGELVTTASLLGTQNVSDTAVAASDYQFDVEVDDVSALSEIVDVDLADPILMDSVENSLSEFEFAIAELEHSLLMAEEVRVAFDAQMRFYDRAKGSVSTPEQIQWDANHLANVTEAINATEVQFQQIMANAAADEVQAIVDLAELRDSLVNVIEPFGPWENPNNLPASWLALLPNGDPRNLRRGDVVGIGPESVAVRQEFNHTFIGNDGLNHNSEFSIVRMVCDGPDVSSSRDTVMPTGISSARCLWSFFGNNMGGVFRGANFNFNSDTGLFENHLSNAHSTHVFRMAAFRCLQLHPNVDSELFPNGVDLERDDDGFLVFELFDTPLCTDNPDHWLNLLPSGGNAGHNWALNLDD